MLSEISQREKDDIPCYHLYVEFKKQNKQMNITKKRKKEKNRRKMQAVPPGT